MSGASVVAKAAGSASVNVSLAAEGARLVARLFTVGETACPVLVVDNVATEPHTLCRYADEQAQFTPSQDFYPGLKALAPGDYAAQALQPLASVINEVFNLQAVSAAEIAIADSCFALANQAPDSLRPIQCIPHFDSHNPKQIAVVHYLYGDEAGGTSFYRHRETQLETVVASQAQRYRKTLERQATTVGLPKKGYISGSTALFELIGSVPARYNRAVFYPSHLLHSGNITMIPAGYSTPSAGRLTITSAMTLKS